MRVSRDDYLADLLNETVRRCLSGAWRGSPGEAGEALAWALAHAGYEAGETEELGGEFLQAYILELLSQVNSICCYPHSDSELAIRVLPIWMEIFRNLQRPWDLARAIWLYLREYEYFPTPAAIMAMLPDAAFRKAEALEDCELRANPELRREICGRVREKCRVLKFRELARTGGK